MRKTVSVPLGDPQEPRLRLRAVGLGVAPAGDKVMISNVAFGSYAKRIGLEAGYEVVAVLEPADRPSRAIPAVIALLIAGGIAALQFSRRRKQRDCRHRNRPDGGSLRFPDPASLRTETGTYAYLAEAVICEPVSPFPWYQGKIQGIRSIQALMMYLTVRLCRWIADF